MSLTELEEHYLRNYLSDYGTNESMVGFVSDVFAITTNQNTVTLSKTPGTVYPVFVYKNGVLLYPPADYSRTAKVVTFTTGLVNGNSIRVNYNV